MRLYSLTKCCLGFSLTFRWSEVNKRKPYWHKKSPYSFNHRSTGFYVWNNCCVCLKDRLLNDGKNGNSEMNSTCAPSFSRLPIYILVSLQLLRFRELFCSNPVTIRFCFRRRQKWIVIFCCCGKWTNCVNWRDCVLQIACIQKQPMILCKRKMPREDEWSVYENLSLHSKNTVCYIRRSVLSAKEAYFLASWRLEIC